jgi:hypothetical protein
MGRTQYFGRVVCLGVAAVMAPFLYRVGRAGRRDAKPVGRDPATGKYWRWTVYGPRYFKHTRSNIFKCIKEWEENQKNVELFNISESGSDDSNVVTLRRPAPGYEDS